MSTLSTFKLPFTEAINFFKKKTAIPIEEYNDLEQSAYYQSFVVAGANSQDIVIDFYEAVTKAIELGYSKQWFEEQFDEIVKKYGWSYNGNAGWRADVIMDTNVNSAYNTGKYMQDTEPILLEAYPYWQYKTMGDLLVRPEHAKWNNYITKYDNPIWKTIYPPNGYSCRCKVKTLDKKRYDKIDDKYKTFPEIEYYKQENRKTGETETRIKGIDRGFETSPATDWGHSQAKNLNAEHKSYVQLELF